MKYIIPENKLDKIVFKYLDNTLKHLEKRKAKFYDGFVLTYPHEKHGILGYENGVTLFINNELINQIYSVFGLEKSDIKPLIIRWVIDRLQLKVRNTRCLYISNHPNLEID